MTKEALKGRSILLVEDEYYQAKETKIFLERAGAHVVGPTAHAEDAENLMSSHSVDAVLLDINLGKGPSFELARILREANVPLLFVTGYDSSSIPSDLFELPRLEKPVSEAELVSRLAAITQPAG